MTFQHARLCWLRLVCTLEAFGTALSFQSRACERHQAYSRSALGSVRLRALQFLRSPFRDLRITVL